MSVTALERAKQYRPGKPTAVPVDKDLVDLSLAWLQDEVRVTAVLHALGKKSNVYAYLARGLREAYRQGLIEVKEKQR